MSTRRPNKCIFQSIERATGIPLPPCIKKILKFAAYDNASSLVPLNEELIADIENFINDCGKDVIDGLSCCNADRYKAQNTFRFLPGHKCSILAIPSQIEKMKGTKRKSTVAQFRKLLTQQELEKMLLTKLNRNLDKIKHNGANINVTFEQKHLSDTKTIITDNSMIAKSTVKCLVCLKPISATFNSSWTTHNVVRHVKLHGYVDTNGNTSEKSQKRMKLGKTTNGAANEIQHEEVEIYNSDDAFVFEEIEVDADADIEAVLDDFN